MQATQTFVNKPTDHAKCLKGKENPRLKYSWKDRLSYKLTIHAYQLK